MRSMTGYGKGISERDGNKITIEVKTVNHRFLDWGLKFPKSLLFLEDGIKKMIGSSIKRGHIDMYLTYHKTAVSVGEYKFDSALANNYLKTAEELKNTVGIESDLTLSSLLKNSDIFYREEVDEDEDKLAEMTFEALEIALKALSESRAREGAAIQKDLEGKLQIMQAALDKIAEYSPCVVEDYRNKLNARIADAVGGKIDEARLATEVAIYADKCCIDEEITRLGTHIKLFGQMLKEDKPVGRDLDFRLQEMNRETNTIGSKANNLRITEEVLTLKNEIEKIREQSQNVE